MLLNEIITSPLELRFAQDAVFHNNVIYLMDMLKEKTLNVSDIMLAAIFAAHMLTKEAGTDPTDSKVRNNNVRRSC